MALPAAISCLLLSFLVALTPVPCTCEEEHGRVTMAGSSLIQCYDPLTNATNATEPFRASLLPLLAALPSAAAPTGFASVSSNGRAFVRGLCFGEATVPRSECRVCLSVAARNLTFTCGATTRRAGIWTNRCFVGYRDTHTSSPAEDAFRASVVLRGSDAGGAPTLYSRYLHNWLLAHLAQPVVLSAVANISAPRMVATADVDAPVGDTMRSTVHVLGQCGRDGTSPECLRCLLYSAQKMNWDIDADRRHGGVAAAVFGFNCNLFINVSTALVAQPEETATASPAAITTGSFVAVVAVFILCALIEW